MDEIKWMENEKFGKGGKPANGTEVSVRILKKGNAQMTKFIFYNDAEQKISHSEYMVCGVSNNRIYFKEEFLRKGYKIQQVKGGHPFIVVTAVLNRFTGDYKLNLDAPRGLWYIVKEDNNANFSN